MQIELEESDSIIIRENSKWDEKSGNLLCSFTRHVETIVEGHKFDLKNKSFYLLLAQGDVDKGTHNFIEKVMQQRYDIIRLFIVTLFLDGRLIVHSSGNKRISSASMNLLIGSGAELKSGSISVFIYVFMPIAITKIFCQIMQVLKRITI